MDKHCNACSKSTHRDEETKKKLNKRLKTIAINKSIKGVSNEIFKNHLSTCVVRDIKNDDPKIIDKVMKLIGRLN